MAKGFFTQSAVVLLEQAIPLADIERALEGCQPKGRVQFSEQRPEGEPPAEGMNWAGAEALVFHMGGEGSRGSLLVDVVDARWPDDPGEPGDNPGLMGAYLLGHMGPFAFPFCLDRAVTVGQSNGFDGQDAATRHKAFVRVRSTYAVGADDDAPVLPEDYDALGEQRVVTEIASTLLELPGALCYFNPGGEVLLPAEDLEKSLDHADQHQLPPLDVWCNVRLFALEDLEGWAVMDTIGMLQLDTMDHEAFFRKGAYDPREIALFLREASYLMMLRGPVVKDGAIYDGPGKRRWKALVDRDSLVPMPRPVVRWVADDGNEVPETILKKPDREAAAT